MKTTTAQSTRRGSHRPRAARYPCRLIPTRRAEPAPTPRRRRGAHPEEARCVCASSPAKSASSTCSSRTPRTSSAGARQLEAMLRTYDEPEAAGRRDPGDGASRRRDQPRHRPPARGDVRHAVRPRGHPRADQRPRRRPRLHRGDRRHVRPLPDRGADRDRRRAGRDHRQAGRADPRRAGPPARASRAWTSTGSRSTASRTRATGSPGRRSPACSTTSRTRSSSSSGRTSTACSRRRSTRPRTSPTSSSGSRSSTPESGRALNPLRLGGVFPVGPRSPGTTVRHGDAPVDVRRLLRALGLAAVASVVATCGATPTPAPTSPPPTASPVQASPNPNLVEFETHLAEAIVDGGPARPVARRRVGLERPAAAGGPPDGRVGGRRAGLARGAPGRRLLRGRLAHVRERDRRHRDRGGGFRRPCGGAVAAQRVVEGQAAAAPLIDGGESISAAADLARPARAGCR